MSVKQLKICVITGSRAEYGLLYPLLVKLKKDKAVQLQLVATGMHLSPEFGLTYRQIEADGFIIDEKVEILLSADTDSAITKSTGLGLIGFAASLQRLEPHWVILLGDRFETFAAATAAHLAKIPVAHLHGGELTEGATDDALRHAITKMAWLHFTSAEPYRQRVIQLGEDPKRVFTTGAIGLDNAKHMKLLTIGQLSKELEFSVTKDTLLVTYHPVTLEKNSASEQMKELLKALDAFPAYPVIFTLPNADANGRVITKLIHEYVERNPGRAKAFTSLGQLRYLSALKHVKAVVGNSSSGIIEAPFFKIPIINIGDRQSGRLKAGSVIDTGTRSESIIAGMQKAFSPLFAAQCKNTTHPYGDGDTAGRIINGIKKAGVPASIKKTFYDLPRV